MYYQEKWEDDIFYIKTTPTGDWKQTSPTLADIYSALESKKISLQKGLNLAYLKGLNFTGDSQHEYHLCNPNSIRNSVSF